jgi:large subunit ribosomal protein L10
MVAESKKRLVETLAKDLDSYPVIAIVDVEGIPADTLSTMRERLRGEATIVMTKKRLMNRVFERLESSRSGIMRLSEHYRGMPALLVTKQNPFRIASLLRKSRTPAPAKAGQIAPRDIIVPKGPTPFAPGPILSELGSIGIKAGVEQGKVAVKEDALVVKEGEPVPRKVADVLARLEIRPMEVGLTMMAAFEDGVLFARSVLEVDESVYIEDLSAAAFESFAVALAQGIMNHDTVVPILHRAARESFVLAHSQDILTEHTTPLILSKAERHAQHLQTMIGG